jgi:LPXTG-motif cell wall-anchored protein
MARVSFTTTTFLSDVDIFAVWNSNVPVKYKVNYVLQETNADGTTTETKIADTLYGEGISGQEVTVSAKIGDELYQGYRGFYDDNFACYAKVATHTITLDATVASAEETGMIEYIFCYIKSTGVTYAVNYWLEQQDETGQPILDATGNPVYALYTKNAEGEWVCSTTTTSASANANANANAGEEADTDSTETDAATSSDSTTAPHSITVKTSQAVITTSAPNFDGYSFIGELPTGSNDILSAPGAFNANGTYLVTRILSAAQTDEITEANTINFYYNYIRPATYELPSTGGQDAKIYILAGLICALLAITLVRHARFSC